MSAKGAAKGKRGGGKKAGKDGSAVKEEEEEDEFKDMECPVCMEIILPPVMACKEGHMICNKCIAKLVAPKKCPQGCGKSLAPDDQVNEYFQDIYCFFVSVCVCVCVFC